MLNLSRNTASDIQLRMYRNTCLTNLAVVFTETGVDCSTTGTNFSMKLLCQFEKHVETFLTTHTITTGNDDRRTFQVMLCLFDMTVDHFHYIIGFRHILGHIVTDYLTLITSIYNFFLHYTFTDGSHLRTMFRINNGSYNVTAECRTDLVQQIFVCNATLLVFMAADLQLGTVGCQTTC